MLTEWDSGGRSPTCWSSASPRGSARSRPPDHAIEASAVYRHTLRVALLSRARAGSSRRTKRKALETPRDSERCATYDGQSLRRADALRRHGNHRPGHVGGAAPVGLRPAPFRYWPQRSSIAVFGYQLAPSHRGRIRHPRSAHGHGGHHLRVLHQLDFAVFARQFFRTVRHRGRGARRLQPARRQGSIIGILLGTTLLQVLQNLVNLLGVPSSLNFAVMGCVILVGVVGDQILQRRAARVAVIG